MICPKRIGLGHAADVARRKSQPLEYGQLLGGQFLEELFAFVRTRRVFFDRLQQFVAHHAAGQLAAVEQFGHARDQQIHVADHRHIDAPKLQETASLR